LRPKALWSGQSAVAATAMVQLGLAMSRWPRAASALISGMTSGTSGSIRKADELSTTTVPDFTAIGAYFFEMPPPAENSAISTPWKE